MDSPSGYKPDSTISDTELERQQQFMQEEFYLAQWNNPTQSSSPKRPNLDDRIHRILSDSPTQNANANAQHVYQQDGYPYPMQHDNPTGLFYNNMYQMPPPPVHIQSPRYPAMNHHGPYDEFNTFNSSRNFVNNSNLVEITQQKRERQRAANSQAVQVGNNLEIVPNNKIATSPETPKETNNKIKGPSTDELKQRAEKRSQAKLKRKVDRERKRLAKHARKEKLRQEIQRYLDAGITADHSDDENLIPLRAVNIMATADRSIVKKSKRETKNDKKVLFSDGILPGETTSEDDGAEETEAILISQQRRKKFRKRRLIDLVKIQSVNKLGESGATIPDPELEKAPAPTPPADSPPPHVKQPRLKKITVEMFAAFPVNPEPIYYYIQKMQQSNGFHPQGPPPPRSSDRFHYYKKQPPPNVTQSPGYLPQHQQQQRSAIPKLPNSGNIIFAFKTLITALLFLTVSSLDPRIHQQRPAEKTFA